MKEKKETNFSKIIEERFGNNNMNDMKWGVLVEAETYMGQIKVRLMCVCPIFVIMHMKLKPMILQQLNKNT